MAAYESLPFMQVKKKKGKLLSVIKGCLRCENLYNVHRIALRPLEGNYILCLLQDGGSLLTLIVDAI